MNQDDNIPNPDGDEANGSPDPGIKPDNVFHGRVDVSALVLREAKVQPAASKDDDKGCGND